MKLDVIKSRTEPNNKNVLWLSPEGLKEYKSDGWKLVAGETSSKDLNDFNNDFNNNFD